MTDVTACIHISVLWVVTDVIYNFQLILGDKIFLQWMFSKTKVCLKFMLVSQNVVI